MTSRTVWTADGGVPSALSTQFEVDSTANRPDSIDGYSLIYDANGNLTHDAKSGNHYSYDFRNRLTRVERGGVTVASYKYDAFNRRVETFAGGRVRAMAYDGWREIEEYSDGLLSERRVFGQGLDEVVMFEADTDGDGMFEEF